MIPDQPALLGTAALVGLLSGLHTATWGMYKDAMYEGFSTRKYARSILVGCGAAIALQLGLQFDLRQSAGLLMLFALAYVLERGLVEFHKSFVRDEDQSKYFIPMAFAIGGRVVTNPMLRRLAGAAYAAAVGLVIFALGRGTTDSAIAHPRTTLLLVASAGGWISAFGGAWKDAPKEGFQVLKFFRSPAVALVYGLALASLTNSWLVIGFGALGLTIATIETHKMFDTSHVRGKFTGKPILYPDTLRLRRRFVPAFAAIWVLLLACLTAALWAPQGGLLAAVDLVTRK